MTDAPVTAPDAPGDGASGTAAPSPADDAPGEPRRRRRLARAAAVAVVAMAAFAASLWALSQYAGGDDHDLAEAREVAGRFAREFEAARLPGVEALFAGTDTATAAEVTDVFTTAIDDERVRALVFV